MPRSIILLSDRKRLILKAVVENYSKEDQPVGSKLLASLPYLNFSSATIRYDMAQLEKKGYLKKTHKSSGRIPSLKGYAFYFNNLITRNNETIKMISLFDQILNKKSLNKEKIIKEVLELLSNLTNYATLMIGPDVLKTNKINKIDFIPLNLEQALILIVTDNGNVQHQNIVLEKDSELSLQDLQIIFSELNHLLIGKYLYEAIEILKSDIVATVFAAYTEYKEQLVQSLVETFYNFATDNFYVYGVSNFYDNSECKDLTSAKDIFKILENEELNRIFFNYEEVIYKFANQISLMPYNKFMIISIPYDINENEKGSIAILGPTIMNFQEIVPLLEYLSAHLSQLYDKNNYKLE